MIQLLVGLVLLVVYPNVRAADWETKDSALLVGALGLAAIDWAQTRRITHEEPFCAYQNGVAVDCKRVQDYRELNPLLGGRPSNAEINRYFLAAMGGTALAAYLLPARIRRPFLGAVIILETAIVVRNHNLGLRIEF